MAQIQITNKERTIFMDYTKAVQDVLDAYKELDEVSMTSEEIFEVSEACFEELNALSDL